ncbi:hypothetical protein K474DRAFT_1668233 [Panus rudis PR-1116 ss-1]|nr:hypothetical protein K474DRAFT_1668233 [Panus rudis PR-1116 ss-1]
MTREYYSHHIPPPSGNPYGHNVQHDVQQPAHNALDIHTIKIPDRPCSVRGCSAMLPPEYQQKMCEACRSRHRIYASTKRAKRKAEKMAMGGQVGPVAWMPPDREAREVQQPPPAPASPTPPILSPPRISPQPLPAPPPAPAPALEPRPEPVPAPVSAPPTSQFPLTATNWDHNAIDPRLVSHHTSQQSVSYSQPNYSYTPTYPHDTSSELARALHLPIVQSQPQHQQQQQQQHQQRQEQDIQHSFVHAPPPQIPQEHSHPQAGPAQPLSDHAHSTSPSQSYSPPQPSTSYHFDHRGETSMNDVSAEASDIGGASLPSRFCSIKGCKAVIPGDSFFKMCEPCRDRYRHYGTTKRAKWRREKQAAVEELQKLRAEEDKRRAEEGLPHFQPDGENPSSHPPNVSTPAPRMCTVSHCREVLPGSYPYLRCERHRLQNRHHSKLKRVRDKESKAVAFESWAAAVSAVNALNAQREAAMKEDSLFGDGDMDEEEEDEDDTTPYTEGQIQTEGEPGSGLPPAARGSRRTNHVCSIKACCNLLSPNNPWKMCDSCRARDRSARRIKALRESGVPVDPLPPRPKTPPDLENLTKTKTKKKAKKKKKSDTAAEQNAGPVPPDNTMQSGVENVAGPSGSQQGDGANTEPAQSLVFMDPVYTEHNDTSPSSLSFILSGDLSGAQGTYQGAQPSQPPESSNVQSEPPADSSTAGLPNTAPAPASSTPAARPAAKKKTKRKAKATTETATPATTAPAAPAETVQMHPPGTMTTAPHIQPHYQVPYYMPPPYAMPAYPGARYPYPPYSRDPYAPSPMYQPPPYPYPYAYPHPQGYGQAYGQPYPPPPMPQSQPPPQTQPQAQQQAQPVPQASSTAGSTSVPGYPMPSLQSAAASSAASAANATPPSNTTPTPTLPAASTSAAPSSSSLPINTPPNSVPATSQPPVQPSPAIPPAPTQSQPSPTMLPPPPPDPSTMYSMFASRPRGAGNKSTAGPQDEGIKLTFSAKTGETLNESLSQKRKRSNDQQASSVASGASEGSPGKRQEVVQGGVGSDSGVGMPEISSAQFAAAVSAIAAAGVGGTQPSSSSGSTTSPKKFSCANKTCHRPVHSEGSVCEKCKERLKKKAAQAKQRYHLEPRSLVGHHGHGHSPARSVSVSTPATEFAGAPSSSAHVV